MKRLLLVRHGQSEMNTRQAHTVGGRSSASPLTELGRRQAAALGGALGRLLAPHSAPALVAASTAARARDTAALALRAAGGGCAGAALELSDALLELDQGEWEGAPRSDCYTPDVLARIAAEPGAFAAPGGESQRDVGARVTDFINATVMPRVTAGGPPAVVVAHGLAIKCFLRGVLGSDPAMTWKLRLDNTGVAELGWVEGGPAAGWHVLRLNDISHLLTEGVPIT